MRLNTIVHFMASYWQTIIDVTSKFWSTSALTWYYRRCLNFIVELGECLLRLVLGLKVWGWGPALLSIVADKPPSCVRMHRQNNSNGLKQTIRLGKEIFLVPIIQMSNHLHPGQQLEEWLQWGSWFGQHHQCHNHQWLDSEEYLRPHLHGHNWPLLWLQVRDETI